MLFQALRLPFKAHETKCASCCFCASETSRVSVHSFFFHCCWRACHDRTVVTPPLFVLPPTYSSDWLQHVVLYPTTSSPLQQKSDFKFLLLYAHLFHSSDFVLLSVPSPGSLPCTMEFCSLHSTSIIHYHHPFVLLALCDGSVERDQSVRTHPQKAFLKLSAAHCSVEKHNLIQFFLNYLPPKSEWMCHKKSPIGLQNNASFFLFMSAISYFP